MIPRIGRQRQIMNSTPQCLFCRARLFEVILLVVLGASVLPVRAAPAGVDHLEGARRTNGQAIISKRASALDLAALVGSPAAFRPFPAVDDRVAWQGLPANRRAAIIAAAERSLNHSWPQLPATLYMDFARTGDRRRFEQPYFARRSVLGQLVLAECVEGGGRFLDDIINGIWAICEESTWVISGHNPGRGKLPDISQNLGSAHHYIEMSTHLTSTCMTNR